MEEMQIGGSIGKWESSWQRNGKHGRWAKYAWKDTRVDKRAGMCE